MFFLFVILDFVDIEILVFKEGDVFFKGFRRVLFGYFEDFMEVD